MVPVGDVGGSGTPVAEGVGAGCYGAGAVGIDLSD